MYKGTDWVIQGLVRDAAVLTIGRDNRYHPVLSRHHSYQRRFVTKSTYAVWAYVEIMTQPGLTARLDNVKHGWG